VSSCDELTAVAFEEVIDDPKRPKTVKKLIFCSGRIYYDLYAEREKRKVDNVVFIRIEQLYPLHLEKLEKIIRSYQDYEECCWVQDEPSNMGAWDFIRHFLQQMLEMKLLYIGRKRSASPAVGSHALHRYQYEAMINQVFEDVSK
jgi:2-oxoglutarate dehydrogenase E1 component